ncbi:GLPGLI family protein [Xanthomarina sp. F2636L]|uniref:GLPGLI family protein n=1 Tax=Xanthomarina sp. F2636L TaxID=2996018 RepID=UPI00225DDAF0|nr:GLPGLI family protein [Xanthomarina sp. F2636L]MCX7551765.1 GLPGLI family protein [Xanthomarina sp. F2636L]
MNFTSHLFKSFSVLIVFLTTTYSFAQQDFQGKATYLSKTTIDMDNFGRADMSEEQKKQIAERMKSMLEKTYFLVFDKTESTYNEEEKLEAPGQGGGFRGMMGSFTGGSQYKNVKENQLLQEQEFFGKQFLVKDSLPKLDWKLSGETKQIGQYTCFKATATKKVDAMDFRSMRRRNNEDESKKATDSTKTKDLMDEIEVPETIEVTAWYTMQIPVNQGPGEYWGLPGLILEVNADRTTILCSKIVLNPEEKETIKKPSKGKEVTQEEYNEIMKKKMEEMREMYGGRGGRGGGRGN